MEVHRQLGHGFLEAVYLEAMQLECAARGIPVEHGAKLYIAYKGQRLDCTYQPDLIGYGAVILELKAVARLAPAHQAQLINYLKATGLERGLLLNFGAPSLEHRRLVFTPARDATPQTLQNL
jgi:GxxExxY protein